jgi:Holliday junction resolvase
MGKMQRNKGSRAERELFSLLSEGLGLNVSRNLVQTRAGGADTIDIPGVALEVKRHEQLSLGPWWAQTLAQAGDRMPLLAYRQSRQPWRFVIDLYDLCPDYFQSRGGDLVHCATLSLPSIIVFLRQKV